MSIRSFGSEYGRWPIDLVKFIPGGVVYCVGVGTDITFEEELNAEVPCEVYGFDPTPEVVDWAVEKELRHKWWHYRNVAITEWSGVSPFYHHKEPSFVTHSVVPGGSWLDEPAVQVEGSTIKNEMKFKGHHCIDYCKLNVGGGYELQIIRSMLRDGVHPKQLAFLSLHMERQHERWVRSRLEHSGYSMMFNDTVCGRQLWAL